MVRINISILHASLRFNKKYLRIESGIEQKNISSLTIEELRNIIKNSNILEFQKMRSNYKYVVFMHCICCFLLVKLCYKEISN